MRQEKLRVSGSCSGSHNQWAVDPDYLTPDWMQFSFCTSIFISITQYIRWSMEHVCCCPQRLLDFIWQGKPTYMAEWNLTTGKISVYDAKCLTSVTHRVVSRSRKREIKITMSLSGQGHITEKVRKIFWESRKLGTHLGWL